MTNSVTFPVDLGGDGSTVTDDDNASTGLGNGGHRTRFVPAMGQVVAVANVLTQRLSSQSDTSSSSIAIGTGSKSFVTAGFYEWAIGMYVMASSAASASNWMYGQVTAWSTSTNTVTVNVVSSNGSGTYSDWVVSLAGPANLSTLPPKTVQQLFNLKPEEVNALTVLSGLEGYRGGRGEDAAAVAANVLARLLS